MTPHFFRHESGRLVAALTRIFGMHNLALAEDVVQDAFCRALEVWKVRGIPDNPSAWLMTAAKHRAIDVVRRERTARSFAPEMGRLLDTEWTLAPLLEEAFSHDIIRDAELRMMLSCCHPRLPEETQIALVLNISCGFGAAEIAGALLTGQAAIEKRLARAKKLLRSRNLFDWSETDGVARLSTSRRALYLLFSEGYHGACPDAAVRVELCEEALRLVRLLCDHSTSATPATFALAALLCLHAARLPARTDAQGELHALEQQDRSRWDTRLMADGLELLERSAAGPELTTYHVEAAIAAVHARATRLEDTDFGAIVSLYDRLISIHPSPVVALNRAIALGWAEGAERGLAALHAIIGRDRLAAYPFYPAAVAELELRLGHIEAARSHFERALGLARNAEERRFLIQRLQNCGG